MKNRTIKKVLSVALASAMVLGMVGCGGGAAEAPAESAAPAADTTEAAPADDTAEAPADDAAAADASGATQIAVYRATFNLANPDSAQVQKVQDAINEYIKDKINVQITLTDVGSGEYTDKANLALNNNEINLLWTASWESTIGTNDLVPQNSVYDLTDLLPGTPLYQSMDEGQWEATKYDGKNYFVPVYKDNVEGYDFMFRKDLVDQHGWDISSVKKLADLEPMLAGDRKDTVQIRHGTVEMNRDDRFGMFHGICCLNCIDHVRVL